jgi:hypothetical protein
MPPLSNQPRTTQAIAFSTEADTGSCEENGVDLQTRVQF